MKNLILAILAFSFAIVSNAQTYQREPNENAEAFVKRALQVKVLAHQVIETKEWDTAKKVILSFIPSNQDTTENSNYNEEETYAVGYAFIPTGSNSYRRVLIDTFYENGGAPKIESVFFVNTDKDKQREIAIIVSTENTHRAEGINGSYYYTYFYDSPNIQAPQERLKMFKSLSEKFSCFEGDKGNKSYKAKYKTAASIKAVLKRMGY